MKQILLGLSLTLSACYASAQAPDAAALIAAAMEHWRGKTSYTEMSMTIHRPTWERTMSMQGWTSGDDTSLMRVTAPARDAGNGTLLKDNNMWSYAPKINRIIKVPSSMMGQSWMGSDFSNKDINRSTDILDLYTHSIESSYREEGHTVYILKAVPHEDAPVVWGKEVVHIRDDYVMLKQEFWDQEGILVKQMEATEVREIGGRTVATIMRMGKVEKPDEWTQTEVIDIQFEVDLPANVFTLSNLRNPRQ